MAGAYVTESRNKDILYSAQRVFPNGTPFVDNNFYRQTSRQTTYSWRSGRTLTDEQLMQSWNTTTKEGRLGLLNALDSGHDFHTLKQSERITRPLVRVRSGDQKESFTGPMIPSFTGSGYGFETIPVMSANDIAVYGARGIAQSRPTKPEASLAVTLGEFLREGLPSISELARIRERADFVRQAGSEYLNFQFGWVPLVSDVLAIAKSLSNASKTLQQYYRDSGKVVRRRRKLLDEQLPAETIPGVVGTGFPVGISSAYFSTSSGISYEAIRTLRRTIYFEGAFTYLAPSWDTPSGALERLAMMDQQYQKLLGLRLSPDVLWDLSPWSWFLDWFGTIGDVLSPLDEFDKDHLVIKYGYLMRHTTVARRFSTVNLPWKVGGPSSCARTFLSVRKERWHATPYGFGLNPELFSARQWTILAALGATGFKDVTRGR